MSHKAIQWAWEQTGVTSTEKVVLLAMADAANESGRTFLSNRTILNMCGIGSEETIIKVHTRLIDIGLVSDTGERTGATGRIKVFQLSDEACRKPKSNTRTNTTTNTASNTHTNTPVNATAILQLDGSPNKEEQGTGKQAPGTVNTAGSPTAPIGPTVETLKAPNPNREFSDAWCERFLKRTSQKYHYTPADAVQVARILKDGETPASLIKTLDAAVVKNDPSVFWNCVTQTATACGFIAALNKIRCELSLNVSAKKNKFVGF